MYFQHLVKVFEFHRHRPFLLINRVQFLVRLWLYCKTVSHKIFAHSLTYMWLNYFLVKNTYTCIFAHVNITNPTSWLVKVYVLSRYNFLIINFHKTASRHFSTIKIENRSEEISKKPKIGVCTLSNLDNILKVLMYPLGAFSIMTSFLFDFPIELLYC
jgi:hypothetical protein